jgi:hypothetical protein
LICKESGVGREGTGYAMDEMTDIEHLVITTHDLSAGVLN